MKKLILSLILSISIFSCKKDNTTLPATTTSTSKYSGTAPTYSGCSLSQGYYLAKPRNSWSQSTVTIGGHIYTEAEAKAIWRTSNQGGIPDSKKAFCQLVAIYLSSGTIGSGATVWYDVQVCEDYLESLNKLTPTYLPTGNQSAQVSAGNIGNWINANHCQ